MFFILEKIHLDPSAPIIDIAPSDVMDVYGLGKYEKREKILKICNIVRTSYIENRLFYASNMVGALFEDYLKNCK